MKNKLLASVLSSIKTRIGKKFLLLVIIISLSKQVNSQNTVTLQIFYDELGRYGTWISHSDYGYVWMPAVGPDFFPYGDNGYWLYTDRGWAWTSYYPWGWAAFHYGRWFYDPYYGWLWVPDYYWAPAWVVWCESPGYFGWTPMGPGVSITFALSPAYQPRHEHWRFLHDYDMGRKHISYYYIGMTQYAGLLAASHRDDHNIRRESHSQSYQTGPSIEKVRMVTGKGFLPVIVKSLKQPKEERGVRSFGIYKPEIKKQEKTSQLPAPKKVQIWRALPHEQKEPPLIPEQPLNPIHEPERKREQKQIQDWQNKNEEIKPPSIEQEAPPVIHEIPVNPIRDPERKREQQQIQEGQQKKEEPVPPFNKPPQVPATTKPQIIPKQENKPQQRIDEIKIQPSIRQQQDKLQQRQPPPAPPSPSRPEIKRPRPEAIVPPPKN